MKKYALGLVAAMVLSSGVAFAATGSAITLQEVMNIIRRLASAFFIVASIAVAFAIIWAGLSMVRAQGNDAEFQKAKKQLWHALIGGLVVFGVWVILATIESIAADPAGIFGGGGGSGYGGGSGGGYDPYSLPNYYRSQ